MWARSAVTARSIHSCSLPSVASARFGQHGDHPGGDLVDLAAGARDPLDPLVEPGDEPAGRICGRDRDDKVVAVRDSSLGQNARAGQMEPQRPPGRRRIVGKPPAVTDGRAGGELIGECGEFLCHALTVPPAA